MDRVNRTSLHFYTLMWEIDREEPREGETVDHLHRRLKRLAKNYQPWGRYFRVRRVGDVVLWQRVPQGLHTRLGQWHNLEEGEELRIPTVDARLELKRAKASARYLRSAGKGLFHVELDGGTLKVRRLPAADTSQEGGEETRSVIERGCLDEGTTSSTG